MTFFSFINIQFYSFHMLKLPKMFILNNFLKKV